MDNPSSDLDSKTSPSNFMLKSSSNSYSIKKINDSKYASSNKKFSFNSSNFLPIITNFRPIDETNSISFISNRSIETPRESTSSLVSSPSSLSVNNSIECKTDGGWAISKGASFLKLHLNSTNQYSPEQENWRNTRQSIDNQTSSQESFRYTISNRYSNDLENNFTNSNQKLDSKFIKSFSFNSFSHLPPRKYSVDNLVLAASTARYATSVQQRKQFQRNQYASSASLKIKNYKFNNNNSLKQLDDLNYFNKLDDHINELNNFKNTNPHIFDRQESTKSDLSNKDKNFTKLQKITLLCILTVSFCSYCSMSILAPFFPKKASEKGLSETQAGFVFSVFALISVLFSPFLGKLVPIFGAKALILFGIFLGGISNLLFGIVENVENPKMFFSLCVLIRILESFGTCAHATASYTYVIKLFPNSIGFVFGLTETFVGMALCLGPGIGSFLFTLGGYKLPFFIFGGVVLLCLPFNLYFLINLNETTDLENDKDSSTESSNETEQVETTYWRLIKIPKIFVICMVIVVMSLASAFLEPTLEPHLRTRFNLRPEIVGLEFLLSSSAYALSTPIVGALSSKTKNKFGFMLIGTLITLIGTLIIGPSKLLFFAPSNVWLSTVGVILISFGHGVGFICTFECVFDYCLKSGFKDNIKTYGKISGLWSCLFSLGEFIGPLLGAYIVQISDFEDASTIIAAICAITLPFIMFMYFKVNQEINEEKDLLNEELKKEVDLNKKPNYVKIRSNSCFIPIEK